MSTSNVLSLSVPTYTATGFVDENVFHFTSPTYGPMTFETVCQKLTDTIANSDDKFTIMVGTDSHVHNNRDVCFVTVVFVHRVSKGGHFFIVSLRKAISPILSNECSLRQPKALRRLPCSWQNFTI